MTVWVIVKATIQWGDQEGAIDLEKGSRDIPVPIGGVHHASQLAKASGHGLKDGYWRLVAITNISGLREIQFLPGHKDPHYYSISVFYYKTLMEALGQAGKERDWVPW